METNIYLPTLSHWQYENKWSGEIGQLRFLVTPIKSEMTAELWHGPLSREFSEPEATAVFPVTEEGLADMKCWLRATARELAVGSPVG